MLRSVLHDFTNLLLENLCVHFFFFLLLWLFFFPLFFLYVRMCVCLFRIERVAVVLFLFMVP